MMFRCDGVKYASPLFGWRTTSDLILRGISKIQCQAQKSLACLELRVSVAPKRTHARARAHTHSYSIHRSFRISDLREYDYLRLFAKRFNLCYHRFQNRFSFSLQIWRMEYTKLLSQMLCKIVEFCPYKGEIEIRSIFRANSLELYQDLRKKT
jgi:hypothetical protein